jgi:hypothetical protein
MIASFTMRSPQVGAHMKVYERLNAGLVSDSLARFYEQQLGALDLDPEREGLAPYSVRA